MIAPTPAPIEHRAEIFVHAPYDQVWQHFTTPSAYTEWSSAPGREFGEAPGDPVAWGPAERVLYRGTIEAIARGVGITHTFEFVGFGFEEPPSRVQIAIQERGEVVWVEILHRFEDAPQTAALIGPHGWSQALSRLKTLLETGRAMPWPEFPGQE